MALRRPEEKQPFVERQLTTIFISTARALKTRVLIVAVTAGIQNGDGMSTTTFTRWSGMAAMLGGLFWIATLAITATKPEDSRRGPEGFIVLLLVGLLLIGVGVVGIYFRQRHHAGWLGTWSAALALVGLAVTILGRVAVDANLVPALVFQFGLLLFVLGMVLFVVSMFMANVLPRAAAWLLVISMLAFAVFNFGDERIWMGTLFGAAWIWLGYALWSGPPEQSEAV